MSQSVDEDEHSIEMHLPYVRKVFEGFVCSIWVTKSAELEQEEHQDRPRFSRFYLNSKGEILRSTSSSLPCGTSDSIYCLVRFLSLVKLSFSLHYNF